MTYGNSAMVPVEVSESSVRRTQFEEALNDKNLALELDRINEVRNHAEIQEEARKRRAT